MNEVAKEQRERALSISVANWQFRLPNFPKTGSFENQFGSQFWGDLIKCLAVVSVTSI